MSNLPITRIVIHTSATEFVLDIGRDEIDRYHRAKGWNGIGYHYVIRRNGSIEIGRQEHTQGAHVLGYNKHSLGICMIGGLTKGEPDDNYTDAQYSTLKALLINLRDNYPDADICGHRDYSPDLNGDGIIEEFEWVKVCPCFDVKTKLKDWGIE